MSRTFRRPKKTRRRNVSKGKRRVYKGGGLWNEIPVKSPTAHKLAGAKTISFKWLEGALNGKIEYWHYQECPLMAVIIDNTLDEIRIAGRDGNWDRIIGLTIGLYKRINILAEKIINQPDRDLVTNECRHIVQENLYYQEWGLMLLEWGQNHPMTPDNLRTIGSI